MSQPLSRRELLRTSTLTVAAACTGAVAAAGEPTGQASGASPGASSATGARPEGEPFGYCLNTSTIRGQKLSLVEEIDIAAKAGYTGIEPWIREIQTYVDGGGSMRDLRRRIEDRGLSVESAIGFAAWLAEDETERKKGLETARHDMDLVRQLGGKRIAAPPVGATMVEKLNLDEAARRYRALAELGQEMGVVAELELWGHSRALSRIGEVAHTAIESGHPQATILLDVYHIYKGGSDFAGLRLLNGKAIGAFHFNDYPAQPPRAEIRDADRVYPGDGVAPLSAILKDLWEIGFRGHLSLELFNPSYWEQDALTVARTGLEKLRQAVAKAFG